MFSTGVASYWRYLSCTLTHRAAGHDDVYHVCLVICLLVLWPGGMDWQGHPLASVADLIWCALVRFLLERGSC